MVREGWGVHVDSVLNNWGQDARIAFWKLLLLFWYFLMATSYIIRQQFYYADGCWLIILSLSFLSFKTSSSEYIYNIYMKSLVLFFCDWSIFDLLLLCSLVSNASLLEPFSC